VLIYEYPFNETVRSLLRLEYLFGRLNVFINSDDPEHHLTAISLIFDIGEVTSRADLKSSLLKELERQRALLASFRSEASINKEALESTLVEIERCLATLNNLVGKPNVIMNDSEWLSMIRTRLTVPGGTSPIDLPSFYSWQQRPAQDRRAQLLTYTPAFGDWKLTCDLYLKLLRQSADFHAVHSENGSYQQMLAGKTYQMIRVRLEQNDLIPEISANKHMLWIRFLQNSITSKPQAITASTPFELTLCNL
jgi:cell division protein ZapD